MSNVFYISSYGFMFFFTVKFGIETETLHVSDNICKMIKNKIT